MQKYDYNTRSYRPYTRGEKVQRGVGAAIALGLAYVAIGGDDTKVSYQQGREVATTDYQKLYEQQSPAGKFALQYILTAHISGPEARGGNGIWDLFSKRDGDRRVYNFNNAYDIAGGRIKGTIDGWTVSGSITGRSPTAVALAHVDRDAPNVVVITAGNDRSKTLKFNGAIEGIHLTPANVRTEDALNTFGCKDGVISSQEQYKPATIRLSGE